MFNLLEIPSTLPESLLVVGVFTQPLYDEAKSKGWAVTGMDHNDWRRLWHTRSLWEIVARGNKQQCSLAINHCL
jgi:hypothetical protein